MAVSSAEAVKQPSTAADDKITDTANADADADAEQPEPHPLEFLVLVAYATIACVTVAANFVPIPVHVQLLLSATLPIYVASHHSLDLKPTETMTSDDAWRAPVVGSCALFGKLQFFDKYLSDICGGDGNFLRILESQQFFGH